MEAGPEIWKAYYAGFPTEDHFAANVSCSGVSTHHQSGTWQPPFPSSPPLMQRADTVQLFVSDCSLATHGREGGGKETISLRQSCGLSSAAPASSSLQQRGHLSDKLDAFRWTTNHSKCCCLHSPEEEPNWSFQAKCWHLLSTVSCAFAV